MNEHEQQVEQVRISIEQAKASIAKRDSLKALFKNSDFQAVVLEGYLEKEAIKAVQMKAEPVMQTVEHQDAVDKQITGVGQFRQYINAILQMGNMAEKALADHQQTEVELMGEAE